MHTILQRILAFAAVAALSAGGAVIATLYAQGARGVCDHEYSANCVWFGPLQGDGPGAWHGRIVVNGPDPER